MNLIDTCLQQASALGASCGLVVTALPNAPAGYLRLRLAGRQREWTLEVQYVGPFLTRLPVVRLRPPVPLLAHVAHSGIVCINDSQGLSLDMDRQADVFAYTVSMAHDLLEKSAADMAGDQCEFFNELEGYWLGLPGSEYACSTLNVDATDRLATAYCQSSQGKPHWYITERKEAPPSHFSIKGLTSLRAGYFAFDTPLLPPGPGGKLDAAFISAVLDRLSPVQLEIWSHLVGPSKNSRKQLAMVVSAPRAAGGRSAIGVSFWAHKGRINTAGEVRPLYVRRHIHTYMRERGGASLALLGKHIAVLGCGAVGSEVADALAACGVGQLTLVDPDQMSQDNVFRHVLEPGYIGISKVLALKAQLTRQYPGLTVNAAYEQAQEWLVASCLADIDGVVLCLGLPTLERALSRRLRALPDIFPIVFSWLEPLDLGGHSILVTTGGAGCLDCIYRDDEGNDAVTQQTAFMSPGQPVTRNLTGCASVFVPFGALQSRRTALMAAEHMLSALDGAITPSYRFWVGEGTAAAEQGLQTTNWWQRARNTSSLEATKSLFGRPCRHCRPAS